MNTKTVSQIDANGVFVGPILADESPLEPGVFLMPASTVDALPPVVPEGMRALWNGQDFDLEPIPAPEPEPEPEPAPEPTQFELDERRYIRRAAVKDLLLAWMAADNMGRVRSGAWTVQQLTELQQDPSVDAAQKLMGMLSFELAAQAISNAATPLLTPEIKSVWVSKLTEHFYLVP